MQFEDGEVTELAANVIVESMYTHCDPDGNKYILLDDIIDFCTTDTEFSIEDQKIVVKRRASMRCSTVGWQVFCQWKDGLTSWEKLKDLK